MGLGDFLSNLDFNPLDNIAQWLGDLGVRGTTPGPAVGSEAYFQDQLGQTPPPSGVDKFATDLGLNALLMALMPGGRSAPKEDMWGGQEAFAPPKVEVSPFDALPPEGAALLKAALERSSIGRLGGEASYQQAPTANPLETAAIARSDAMRGYYEGLMKGDPNAGGVGRSSTIENPYADASNYSAQQGGFQSRLTPGGAPEIGPVTEATLGVTKSTEVPPSLMDFLALIKSRGGIAQSQEPYTSVTGGAAPEGPFMQSPLEGGLRPGGTSSPYSSDIMRPLVKPTMEELVASTVRGVMEQAHEPYNPTKVPYGVYGGRTPQDATEAVGKPFQSSSDIYHPELGQMNSPRSYEGPPPVRPVAVENSLSKLAEDLRAQATPEGYGRFVPRYRQAGELRAANAERGVSGLEGPAKPEFTSKGDLSWEPADVIARVNRIIAERGF